MVTTRKKKKTSFLKKAEAVLVKSSQATGSTIRIGFNKLNMGIGLPNYAMNRIMTGTWNMGFRFGRNYAIYGESGSGKSLLAAVAAAKAQKEHNAMVLWIDTEHATDDESGKKWFDDAGMNRDDDDFIYGTAKTLPDLKRVISNMTVTYRAAHEEDPDEQRPLIIVVDSWNMGLTESKYKQMVEGKLVGDMGQQVKQMGDIITAATHLVEGLPVMLIGVLHVYDSQEDYGRKHKTTGGNKILFAASGALLLTKVELRESDIDDKEIIAFYNKLRSGMDAETKKLKTDKRNILGITSVVENLKSRHAKPFEKVPVNIMYPIGFDPYSGLWEQLMFEGVLQKANGAWYKYTDVDGNEKKFQKTQFRNHAHAMMKAADKHDRYAELREILKKSEEIKELDDALEEEVVVDDTGKE